MNPFVLNYLFHSTATMTIYLPDLDLDRLRDRLDRDRERLGGGLRERLLDRLLESDLSLSPKRTGINSGQSMI